jgi:GT2 family glycosyltransferase
MKFNSEIRPKVYLGIPTHDGNVNQGIVNAIIGGMQGGHLDKMQIEGGSALTCNFNNLYCQALNNRKYGVTHFCMMHSDVWVRDAGWLEKLLEVMRETGAGIVGAVIPLKRGDGTTSTAIEEEAAGSALGFRARKLKLDELPSETFTDPKLLLNTGLMLIDVRHGWAEKLWFEFKDGIARSGEGVFYPTSLAEDYGISRMARELGVKLVATKAVKVWHMGGGRFGNDKPGAA